MCETVCSVRAVQVDCAYYRDDASLESMQDPIAALQSNLADNHAYSFKHSCPQCFENLRRLVSI